MTNQPILVEGRNCWRKRRAERVSVLIDAEAYFEAFVNAVRGAERSILIVGWDLDSRVALLRNKTATDPPLRLGPFLNEVVAAKRRLRAHVLVWDFALLFALEREPHLLFKTGWKRHRRIAFHMDGEHPIGASHHQKIVVVDDKIAFAGGIDLTKARWDTPEHRPEDPRRRGPLGTPYQPFHDVQLLVDGEAARSLGDLARERWLRATGTRLSPPRPSRIDPWPAGLRSDLTSVDVAIARTESAYKGRETVREVEALYLDSIEAAEDWIYIENQYFTSRAVQESLASRLRQREGPEVLIVLPRRCSGWLQEGVMGSLRARVLERLRQADTYGRLGVYSPRFSASQSAEVMVHAKVMIADNRLIRVGSANLSNRSMGLDSECDLAIESSGSPPVEEAVASCRNRLLGDHLGVLPEEVAEAVHSSGSLIRAVETLRGGEHTLVPLEPQPSEWIQALSSGSELLDPERPMEIDYMIDQFVREEEDGKGWGLVKFVLLMLLLIGLALLWRFSPLREILSPENAAGLVHSLAGSPASVIYVILAYVVGSLFVIPVTVLITATAAVFGPFSSFGYALAGSVVSAVVDFALGSVLGRDFVRRIAGKRLNRVSARLARRGFVAVLVVRMLPIAPFTAVNVVAGASHIRFRDFFWGTLAGMSPGIVAITILTHRVKHLLREPGVTSVLSLVLVFLVLSLIAWLLSRRLRRPEPGTKDRDPPSPLT